MPAVDRRLIARTWAVRALLLRSAALGVATAALVVAQAWLLAGLLSASFQDGAGLDELRGPLLVLLGVVIARAVLAWLAELMAHRAGTQAKAELRMALLRHVVALGPAWLARHRTAELEALGTRGLDALDGYFTRYLPQLVLAVVIPTAVITAAVTQDIVAAAIIAVTVPLIPLLMAVVGAGARAQAAKRLVALQRLGGHFLDSIAGLTTLKVFGRARAQADLVRRTTDDFREETMGTLRVAFLSSLVLELLASLSVAVVAVAVGIRLVSGDLDLSTGLFVLILAPEAYLPLRTLGASFHASADGAASADQVFTVLDSPLPAGRTGAGLPYHPAVDLRVDEVCVSYPDRAEPALDRVSLSVRPGEVVALTGPSGCGKSTLLAVLLGFVGVDSGQVTVCGVDLAELDLDLWRRNVAWVPQRPYLLAASLADNVRLGRPDAAEEDVLRAVHDAGLAQLTERLPHGLATPLGERGAGLSAGERQRLALARAFLLDAPLLLLDEPTANLDGETEASVLAAVARLTVGRTALIAAHRPGLVTLADKEIRLERATSVGYR
ncbi:ATP-binding cassette subfamily C protein CydD [Kribbella orskensis]|uniref:ATP-binding cassette subfamily C protein CydD n=1 Tax=Kribbella orskensis TaxID=2512216 RepID=A0ABY2BRQ2_9ACTN|nr:MULTISPECIES: thiol reductant ABC exporter subunit CydD [Kribbella]TCN43048.1 ATP-binding cassette subfamily C protein CydD [Kribbella sp. VKM Ac-2500]TCO29596.1 ATP-binding cassette subfamily C protein CydD [Kribbella orskensis]